MLLQRTLWETRIRISRGNPTLPSTKLLTWPLVDVFWAFVIHGSHSSITIYYCKFLNKYLSEISRFGKNFTTKRTFTGKVKPLRTKKFSFRDTNDRVELFGLVAKLLWYLVSGKSKVGYLYNYPDNPLHNLVLTIHLWKTLTIGENDSWYHYGRKETYNGGHTKRIILMSHLIKLSTSCVPHCTRGSILFVIQLSYTRDYYNDWDTDLVWLFSQTMNRRETSKLLYHISGVHSTIVTWKWRIWIHKILITCLESLELWIIPLRVIGRFPVQCPVHLWALSHWIWIAVLDSVILYLIINSQMSHLKMCKSQLSWKIKHLLIRCICITIR